MKLFLGKLLANPQVFVLSEITRKKDNDFIQKCIAAYKTGESTSEAYTMPPLLTTAILKKNQPNDTPSKKVKRIKRTSNIPTEKTPTKKTPKAKSPTAKTSEGNLFLIIMSIYD